MANLSGKNVLIFQQRQWGVGVGHVLAQELAAMGNSISGLTLKYSTHEFTLKQTDVQYAHLRNINQVTDGAEEYLGGEEITLAEICRELGVDSIWPLVQAVRNFVKCYRDKYRFGFKQNVDDETIIQLVKAWYKLTRDYFEECRPDVIICPVFVSLVHIFFNLYARKRGVPMIGIYDTKVERTNMITTSYKVDEGPVFRRLKALQDGETSENEERAVRHIAGFRETFYEPTMAPPPPPGRRIPFKKELLLLINIVRRLREGSGAGERRLGMRVDTPTPSYMLRDYFAEKKNKKDALEFPYSRLEDIPKYGFFPLQVQPEMMVDVIAPYFNNQIETARQVAMSMPDDYCLVVKDHPVMSRSGWQSRSYLEKLARTPNVKLVDFRLPPREVLAGADFIVSPNSTTMFEAAYFNIPCIQLGDFGLSRLLPNVFVHREMRTLGKKIREVLAMDLKTPEFEVALRNYVAAVYDVGILHDHDFLWYNDTNAELQEFCRILIGQIAEECAVWGR